ncbi:hypothetical protein FB446DRAFT_790216 [Lentinula raphanica]|nr:hypothetical protein FB446DRAFT_790216 [Lentinula raphanica]
MRFVPFAYIVLCLVSFAYSLPVPVGRGKAASESRLQTRNAPTITKFESFTFTGVPFESGKDSDFRKKDARDIVTKGIREKTSLSAPHKDVPWTWSTKEGNGDGRHAGYCDVYVGKDKVATFHYQLKKGTYSLEEDVFLYFYNSQQAQNLLYVPLRDVDTLRFIVVFTVHRDVKPG